MPSSTASAASSLLFGLLLLGTHLGLSVVIVRNHMKLHNKKTPMLLRTNQSSCALFIGNWVRDQVGALYDSSQCPLVDAQFDCRKYGRLDSDYLHYHWQPVNCNLPTFKGIDFLEYIQGGTLMFVGDSLGRNQWESLICMISATVPDSEMQLVRGEELSVSRFQYYNATISYLKAPYLVDIVSVQGQRVLKLEEISINANAWLGAHVLVFNTGHWWLHTGKLQGWDYIEYGGKSYRDLDRLVAFEMGLETWASWVDSNVDRSTTKVFFTAISPTHDKPADSNIAGKNCYKETKPLTEEEEAVSGSGLGIFSEQMKVVYKVMSKMRKAPYFLDITALSQLRKDAHPSIYSGDLNPKQKATPTETADCSHWCLPGLPDTWNQLFYAALF